MPDLTVPCKIWKGMIDPWGYGRASSQFRASHGTDIAHRIAWIDAHGQPPAETPLVLHACDNPPCHEVAHLFLGTQLDNMRDMSSKRRAFHQKKTHCANGHPFDEANTRIDRHGWRWCRACAVINTRRHRDKRRAAA